MARMAVAVTLGLFSPVAFLIGGEAFGAPGPSTPREILGGCGAGAVYLAICQFLVARKSRSDAPVLPENTAPFWQPPPGRLDTMLPGWPLAAGMLAPLLGAFFLIMSIEKASVVYSQGVPMLIAGLAGTLAGAFLGRAASRHRRAAG